MAELRNLFEAIPAHGANEQLVELLSQPDLRIERIVSSGHASAEGFWYEQPLAEWVVVLRGHARLSFADEAAPRLLGPGDFIDITPRRRHRVEWTDPNVPTVWLAIHYRPGAT
jgi:cupin 2 domain-containing protein